MSHWNRYNKEYLQKSDCQVRDLLVKVRKDAGLTQVELAKRIGLNSGTISRIERMHLAGVSYFRYMPKVLKWVSACGGVLKLGFIVVAENTKK